MTKFFEFGDGPEQPRNFAFNTPAFKFGGSANNGVLNFEAKRVNTPSLEAFNSRFGRGLSDLDNLRQRLRPGFGDITRARLAGVRNSRSRGIGTLRDRLSQRRVLGSSFGNADLIRAEREFGEAESQARAEGVLQEVQLTSAALDQEARTISQALMRELQEAQLATGVATSMAGLLSQAAQFEKQIAQQNSLAGFGLLTDIAGTAAGFGLSKAFPSDLDKILADRLRSRKSQNGGQAG